MTGREFILELLDKGYPITLESVPEDRYEVTVGNACIVTIRFKLESSDGHIIPVGSSERFLDVVKRLYNMSTYDWVLPYDACNGEGINLMDIPKIIKKCRSISNININLKENTVEIIKDGTSIKSELKITT